MIRLPHAAQLSSPLQMFIVGNICVHYKIEQRRFYHLKLQGENAKQNNIITFDYSGLNVNTETKSLLLQKSSDWAKYIVLTAWDFICRSVLHKQKDCGWGIMQSLLKAESWLH